MTTNPQAAQLKRYKITGEGTDIYGEPHADGEWARWPDVAPLAERIATLEHSNDTLFNTIKELDRLILTVQQQRDAAVLKLEELERGRG